MAEDRLRGDAALIPASEARARLEEGNKRFAASVRSASALPTHDQIKELANGQSPFAIVLGCSDSRVPSELVFDQGLGDLFVIRVAGNIVAPSQVGSVEYAAAKFATKLVVVLGHTQCGAISATLDELRQPTENQSPNLRSIVDRVRPSVEPLLRGNLADDEETLKAMAVRANIRASVENLRTGSDLLRQLDRAGELTIVGAEYAIETGVVEFFAEGDLG